MKKERSRRRFACRRRFTAGWTSIGCWLIGAAVSLTATTSLGVDVSSGFNVAFVSNGVLAADRSDIISMLSSDPRVETAVLFDATVAVPAFNDLQAFEAILYSSDSHGHVRSVDDDLGNLLADYVDAGGGLLLTTFAFGSNSNTLGLLGRIMSPGYSPFLNRQGQGPADGASLDLNASELSHPTLQNVQSFYAKETNGTVMADVSAAIIARYDNGDPMLAANSMMNVLALNALPSPGTTRGELFLQGDFKTLIVNALRYSAGVPIPEPSAGVLLGFAALGVLLVRSVPSCVGPRRG